jgi:DNA polymerase-3 subunit delta
MAKALHAIDYLAAADAHPPRAVCVAFGDEPFLRRQVLRALRDIVLAGEEADFSISTFSGPEAAWRDVHEDLATMAMFGGRRFVVVDEADDFVSRNRETLEKYVAAAVNAAANPTSVLLLDLKSFPSNTRLYKAVDAQGLAIDCSAPATAILERWLIDWAKRMHKVSLAGMAAGMLVEQIGPELGLLDQEVAKLALLASADKKITAEMITKHVGGWRAKTAWDMLDLALDGNLPAALEQVDRLLASGEAPIGVLAQVGSTLRRLAAATRLILQAEASGRRLGITDALREAGVKPFVLRKVEPQLRRLGRERGAQLYRMLLEADLDLKGESPAPPRVILERLLVRIAGPVAQASNP